MHEEKPTDSTDMDSPSTPSQDPAKRKSPGVLNAVLLCASVATILGIYGFSIYQTSRVQESEVFTPPKPVRQPLADTTAEPTETQPNPNELAVAEPVIEPSETGEETPESSPRTDTQEPDLATTIDTPETETSPQVQDPATPVEEVAAVDEEEFLNSGWKIEASNVLKGFLDSKSTEERRRYIIDPDRVANVLRTVDAAPTLPWSQLSTQDFKHINLSESDRRKGIFLMLRDVPGSEEKAASAKSYAFFKRTDEGLKLDLEIFLQTTGTSFQSFTAEAHPGTTQIFRVFITEDPSSTPDTTDTSRTYIIAGLANFDSAIRVRVTRVSPIGRILEAANFKSDDGQRQVMRNATVELRWTDQAANSSIELSRFICWEFLGLGGQPMDDPITPQW